MNMHTKKAEPEARIICVQDDFVTFETNPSFDVHPPIKKNEVVYVCTKEYKNTNVIKLKAEILRIRGNIADAQVFESTQGVAIGDAVELTNELLSIELGPGLLGMVYDGLQNPLERFAADYGYFLPRGVIADGLSRVKKWSFVPSVSVGDNLNPGSVLGTVQEGRLKHKIMVPFDQEGEVEVTWIQEGSFTVDTPLARISDKQGKEQSICLMKKWPVRKPLSENLIRQGFCERLYPSQPLVTSIRLIDTFFPIALGGTGCIPGPFGAGKTVLQNLIARFSDVDIVILVACGERAGEVVETITNLPRQVDLKTGGTLMDRTIIVCNTSSMPVAAREASIYTGITFGEYYRQMGYRVLVLADSTSRWAQAMRETSGRLEEIPGEEAFPAYLDSSIRRIYERAGVIRANDGSKGSLTLIGTVSPAGGNFEEPVTQSTLNIVKAFLGLSSERAYKRFYPAIDPLISWSHYLKQMESWLNSHLGAGWTDKVFEMLDHIKKGDEVLKMMQVTGEEGVTLEDYIVFQKSVLLDMVYLQQDAFDDVDASVPLDRQKHLFLHLVQIIRSDFNFSNKDDVRGFFTKLIGLFKNLNYSKETSTEYQNIQKEIENLVGGLDQ